MSKWIEAPNNGLINADYIISVMPHRKKDDTKESSYDFQIEINLGGELRYLVDNFSNKEHRDSRLNDLKSFLKNCCAGTFIFKEEENKEKGE